MRRLAETLQWADRSLVKKNHAAGHGRRRQRAGHKPFGSWFRLEFSVAPGPRYRDPTCLLQVATVSDFFALNYFAVDPPPVAVPEH